MNRITVALVVNHLRACVRDDPTYQSNDHEILLTLASAHLAEAAYLTASSAIGDSVNLLIATMKEAEQHALDGAHIYGRIAERLVQDPVKLKEQRLLKDLLVEHAG